MTTPSAVPSITSVSQLTPTSIVPVRRLGARPVERVRTTLLCSGIAAFRARGVYDAYLRNLSPEVTPTILSMVAGGWLPIATAMAHFAAVDAIGMSDEDACLIGGLSGKRVHSSVLQTMARLAAGAIGTPWPVFDNFDRVWSRMFDGGSGVASHVGPKEALLTVSGAPMSRFSYFRNAARGAMGSGVLLFSRTVYVREVFGSTSADGFALRVSWV